MPFLRLLVAGIVLVALKTSTAFCQLSKPPAELAQRMELFVTARKFYDVEVMKDLVPTWFADRVRDTLLVRHRRFRDANVLVQQELDILLNRLSH